MASLQQQAVHHLRPVIQRRREVVPPEASPLPLVIYTQQIMQAASPQPHQINRRRPRSESPDRPVTPARRSRSPERVQVVACEKVRVVESSSTLELVREKEASIIQLREEVRSKG